MNTIFQSNNPAMWLLIPPGDTAILRYASPIQLPDMRLATMSEMLTANQGKIFPWGDLPTPRKASELWHRHAIGYGGLYHHDWFITQQGRVGGAENVPKTLPGSLRHNLLLDGGQPMHDHPADNEGYALIKAVGSENRDYYRTLQLYASEFVGSDAGAIVTTPLFAENKAMVGFVGRCQFCPNPERLSIRALQAALPDYQLDLLPEWKNWHVTDRPKHG